MDARIDWLITGLVLFCTLATVVIGYLTYCNGRSKDDKTEGASIATIGSDMGYIKSSIDGLSRTIEKQGEKHLSLVERVCEVEASTKSAHKRLDYFEEKEVSK